MTLTIIRPDCQGQMIEFNLKKSSMPPTIMMWLLFYHSYQTNSEKIHLLGLFNYLLNLCTTLFPVHFLSHF